jgi:hypothetical protein
MSEPINDGGPAFPHEMNATQWGRSGMSLRDYYAAKAMAAMITHKTLKYTWDDGVVACWSFQAADSMLAARDKKEGA